MGRLGRLRGDEEGQVLPVLLVLFLATLALGVVMFQAGRASDLRAEGVTAADAAALAGANNLKEQLVQTVLRKGYADPNAVSEGMICEAARDYAARNGASLDACEHFGYEVSATVRMNRSLDGDQAEYVGVGGRTATAEATARVNLRYSIAFGGGGGGFAATGTRVSSAEIEELADKAGVPVPSLSSLMYSRDCMGGVDTIHLSEAMKIAILKAEHLLGAPLQLSDGFRTYACQVDRAANPGNPGGRAAPPGHSLHEVGMAIDVSNYSALASVAAKVGLCQPFPAVNDDPFHFSLSGSVECGGHAGPLGPGGAFGGNVGSFVTFDVILVE
jgi:hypothetical protein